MQLVMNIEDVRSAPQPVKDWFLSHLGLPVEKVETNSSSSKAKSKPDKVEKVVDATDVKDVTPPTIESVLTQAKKLIDEKGEAVLKQILEKLEIKRVKDCPEGKRAALLAEIAIHA